MKIFDFLRRSKNKAQAPLATIRTVRPPGDVRAKHQAARAKEFEDTIAMEADKKLDDVFMDTGSLELQSESSDMADPYETHSWEMDPDEGLRRVDDQLLGNRSKPEGTPDNPYDTIVKKKGW